MKKRFLLGLIILFAWFFYRESLSFYFISDDFYYLSFNTIPAILNTFFSDQHFIPVFLTVILTVKKLSGLNPYIFHLSLVLVHLTNISLIFILGKKLLMRSKSALLSAFIYSIFFSHYETVYWISGLSLSLMVLFYLSGLICLLNYINGHKRLYLWGYVSAALLAFMSHEYAITLLIFPFLLRQKSAAKPGIALILTVSGSFLVRQFLGNIDPPQQFRIINFLKGIVISHVQLFLPLPQVLEKIPGIGMIFLFLLIIYFLFRNFRYQHFILLLWLESVIFLFSATSLPQARYYYLASIPAIYLLVDILKKESRIFLSIFLISNLVFLNGQSQLWRQSGLITEKIVRQISRELTSLPPDKKLYVVSLLDSLNGPPWHAYLFRNGVKEAVELIGKTDADRLLLVDPTTKIPNKNSLILKYENGLLIRDPL